MQPDQSKSNFFITLTSIAFIIVVGTSLLITIKRPVSKTLFVGNASEAVAPEPGKVDVESDLVAGFPDFPVYPGASIVDSYKKAEGTKAGYEANWKVDDSVSQVVDWYYESLIDSGWSFDEQPREFLEVRELSFIITKEDLRVYLIIERELGALETEISVEVPVQ